MEYVISALSAIAGGAFSFAVLHRAFASPLPVDFSGVLSGARSSRAHDSHIGRLISTTNRLLPQSKGDAEALRGRIARAGLLLPPSAYHGFVIMFWATTALLVAVLMPMMGLGFTQTILASTLTLAVVLATPRVILGLLARKRIDQIRSALPKALDLLAISVEAGLTMERAMHLYAQEATGPLAREFDTADREMNTLGFSRTDALLRMGERCGVEELSLFVGAVSASAAAGSPIADVLRTQSEAAFERRRQYFEEQGNKLTSKMILPMGAFLVPAVLIAAIAPMIINITSTASGVI